MQTEYCIDTTCKAAFEHVCKDICTNRNEQEE